MWICWKQNVWILRISGQISRGLIKAKKVKNMSCLFIFNMHKYACCTVSEIKNAFLYPCMNVHFLMYRQTLLTVHFLYAWNICNKQTQQNLQYQKYDLFIPRNKTVRPHSQFLHSCICERFQYSQDRSSYLASAK